MNGSLKLIIGAAAFVAPIMLGVAYTGAASVGVVERESHNVDQWTIEKDASGEYTIDREEINGVVTVVVTDPSGNAVTDTGYPEFVAEAVAEFGSPDWEPAEDIFDVADGVGCYDADALAVQRNAAGDGESDHYGATMTSSEQGSFALEVWPGGQIDAAWFADQLDDEVLQAQLASGNSYLDLPGAQPLNPCG